MNKKEIKQIILEEIEAAVNDMADDITDDNVINNNSKKDLIEPLATILSIPDIDQNDRIAQAMETGDEDELENLAAGELDRAGLDEMARKSETWKATPKFEQLIQYFSGKSGVEGLTQLMIRVSDHLFKAKNVGFKSRSKKPQSMYFVKGRSVKDGIKGENDVERMRGFAELLLNPNGFTQKDIQNYVGLKNSAQANDFKMKLYRAKLINVVQENDTEDVSESKKNLEFDFSQVNTPEKLPIDIEEQDLMDNIKKELKSSAEDYQNDDDSKTAQQLKDAVDWVNKNGLTGKVTIGEIYNFLTEFHKQLPGDDKMFLHEPTILELVEDEFKPYVDTEEEYQKIVSSVKQYLSSKQPQTMSELEKYIKQVIREAKNPLAKRMKEIETQGRVAALETKLAAMAEMIEETEGRLTRIDEDNEFKEMMDKNAVRDVRKQLKELERAQAKLQKEYDKVSGGRKRETVVDELDAEETRAKADKFDDLADRQDALDQEAGEVEEVSLELNESTLRMQKLAGLITESELKDKLSLNEDTDHLYEGFLDNIVKKFAKGESEPENQDETNASIASKFDKGTLPYVLLATIREDNKVILRGLFSQEDAKKTIASIRANAPKSGGARTRAFSKTPTNVLVAYANQLEKTGGSPGKIMYLGLGNEAGRLLSLFRGSGKGKTYLVNDENFIDGKITKLDGEFYNKIANPKNYTPAR